MNSLTLDKIKEGEPMVKRAVDALRRYHQAQGKESAEEIERLRLEAEALFTAVSEYQRRALGGAPPSIH